MASFFADLLVRIGASGAGFQSELKEVSAALSSAAKQASRSLEGINKFGQSLSDIGQRLSLSVTAPLVAFAGVSLKASASLDTLTRGLTATMKSADKAKAELKKLQEVAKLPAIDLEDAVRGSIRLQTLGTSADEARRTMKELANAVATVGGTKLDFSEVLRQLSQMSSLGRVTNENLKPILERVPQIAAIIKEKFGAKALGEPADEFKRLGVSAGQAIKFIIDELAKTDRATGGTANAFENLKAAGTRMAEAVGDSIVKMTGLDKKLVALSNEVERLAVQFRNLPDSVKAALLGVAGFSAVLGPAVFLAGQLAQSLVAIGIAIKGAMALFSASAVVLAGWSAAVLAGAAAVGVLAFAHVNLRHQQQLATNAEKDAAGGLIILESKLRAAGVSIDALSQAYKRNEIPVEEYRRKLIDLAKAEGDRLAVSRGVVDNMSKEARGTIAAAAAAERAAKALAGQAEASKALKKEAERQDRIVDANIAMHERYEKSAQAVISAQEDIKEATAKAVKEHQDYQTEIAKSAIEMRKQVEMVEITAEAWDRIPPAVQAAIQATLEFERALEGAGVDRFATAKTVEEARKNYDIIAKDARATRAQELGAWIKWEETRQDLARSTREVVTEENTKALEDAKKELDAINGRIVKNTSETWEKIKREVDRAFSGIARGMADSIVKWKGFGETLKSIAQEFASGILEVFIKRLLDPLQEKFTEILGTVFGKDGKVGIINNAVGGTAGAAGSAGSKAGGATGSAGAAAGSLTGIIGAAGSVVGAVSSVIGNFQMAGMNKSLDLIEHATRFSESHLLHLIGEAQKWWPELGIIRSYLFDNFNPALASLMSTVEGMAGKKGSNQTIQLVVDGKVLAEALARVLPHHSNAFA